MRKLGFVVIGCRLLVTSMPLVRDEIPNVEDVSNEHQSSSPSRCP